MAQIRRYVGRFGVGLLAVTAALGFGGAVGADGAEGTTMSISFPPTTVVDGAPGTVHEVASSDVAADQQGQTCSVTVTTMNNVSTHPQSDVLVDSDGTQVTAADVEAVPGASTTATGTLTLGSTVTVSVMLGPDGAFSGGGTVDLVCSAVEPTSTEPTSTTTPSTTSTTEPAGALGAEVTAQPAPAAVLGAVEVAPGFTG